MLLLPITPRPLIPYWLSTKILFCFVLHPCSVQLRLFDGILFCFAIWCVAAQLVKVLRHEVKTAVVSSDVKNIY
ncbi:hypothetical protein DAPPUDRAFT_303268 [Daphnia pulex]|uniref:Uncharacterized protein n=1 Tax=Daphnia pulex TaxID=6669 RepID=E9FSK0_DAPPU|nr:hypothetical protein DAPPUDRAFT_303268 [Daphnia pulex]|eukprot:EFX89816.1 hypothetical protein DAPPUDRAFT_303268 [Daphnia pulex]